VLKSKVSPLLLIYEYFTLCKNRDLKVRFRDAFRPIFDLRLDRAQTSAGLWKDAVDNSRDQRNPSRKFAISMLKFPSFFRSSSTFRIEWMTVEWCFPPKLRPISGSDACVSDLQRYIAT
jgi:hypothetical protein